MIRGLFRGIGRVFFSLDGREKRVDLLFFFCFIFSFDYCIVYVVGCLV